MPEQIFRWGREGHLVAIWTPPQAPAGDIALVMLNAGVIHRVGAHRLHVKLARELAALGIGSVRFDFSGLGDSGLPADAADFRDQAQQDVREVLDALQAELGIRQVALLGICSGAAHAQAAAVADPRVCGVFLIDGFMYPSWRGRWAFLRRMTQAYGAANVCGRLARHVKRRLHDRIASGQAADINDDRTPTRSAADFSADMQQLVDRGVAVTLMFTGSVLETFGHPRQLHDVFRGRPWLPRVRCVLEADVDHTMTLAESQAVLRNRVREWLSVLSAGSGRSGQEA